LGRGLLFPFAIGGIVILGLVVSSIRSLVLDRGKKKLSARMTENMRKKVVRQAEAIQNAKKAKHTGGTGLKKDLLNKLSEGPHDDPDEELHRRQAEFEAMRKVQSMSDQRQKWMNLFISTSAFAVLVRNMLILSSIS
jgi:potassium channel subfamily K